MSRSGSLGKEGHSKIVLVSVNFSLIKRLHKVQYCLRRHGDTHVILQRPFCSVIFAVSFLQRNFHSQNHSHFPFRSKPHA